MSKIEYNIDDDLERVVTLGSLNPGNFFRFSYDSIGEAINLDLFYIVLDTPEKDRIMIANPENGERLLRDKSHRVIEHSARILVGDKNV